MKVCVLILAAGSSSRMGEPKQLLPIGETTLLGHTVKNAAASNAQQIFCVLGANAETIAASIASFPVEIICNSDYRRGIGSSIKAGVEVLQAKGFDAVLVVLGDQPNVDATHLNKLFASFEQGPEKISASDYGERLGVPAIFPKKYFEQLKELTGDQGAMQLINSAQDVLKITSANLVDIDTPQEYQVYLDSNA